MIARTATLEQSSHNLLKHCLAGAKRLAFSFKVLYTTLVVTLRGVAQLIARSVWDREVEGLSPFTPTKKKPVHLGRFFLGSMSKIQVFDTLSILHLAYACKVPSFTS